MNHDDRRAVEEHHAHEENHVHEDSLQSHEEEHAHMHEHLHEHLTRWALQISIVVAVLLIAAVGVGYVALRTDLLGGVQAGATPAGGTTDVSMTHEMDEEELADLYDQVSPSVVHVTATRPDSRETGSGIVLTADGLILTNHHVIEDAESITVRFKDKTELSAEVIEQKPSEDLAVLEVNPSSPLPPVRLGDSDSIRVGQMAVAIGSPFGYEQTLTVGYVSAIGRVLQGGSPGEEIENVIQTDAPINPGNSGGPLLNARGEVIGITTAIYSTSGGSQGIGFAIPIGEAKQMECTCKGERMTLIELMNQRQSN